MKTFVSKHKYKLLFLLIIIIAFSGIFLYSKKKKTKNLVSKESPDTILNGKNEPKEPLIVNDTITEEAPTKEVVKPAIIETKDSPK